MSKENTYSRESCCKRRVANLNEAILLNSTLHTKASDDADKAAQADLEVHDPAPEVARAHIEKGFSNE